MEDQHINFRLAGRHQLEQSHHGKNQTMDVKGLSFSIPS